MPLRVTVTGKYAGVAYIFYAVGAFIGAGLCILAEIPIENIWLPILFAAAGVFFLVQGVKILKNPYSTW